MIYQKTYSSHQDALDAALDFEKNLAVYNIKKLTYKSTSSLSAAAKQNVKAVLSTALVMFKNRVRADEIQKQISNPETGWQNSDSNRKTTNLKRTFIKVNTDKKTGVETYSVFVKAYPIYNPIFQTPFRSIGYEDINGNIITFATKQDAIDFRNQNYIASALNKPFQKIPYFNVNICNVVI